MPLDNEPPRPFQREKIPALGAFTRRGARVSLHDALDFRLTFRRTEEAEEYLQSWKKEPGGMEVLRHAFRRCERGASVLTMSDDQVIKGVARYIMSGALLLTESAPPVPIATSFPAVPPAADAAVAAAVAAAIPAALAKKPEVAVLPLLEETQIEGAKVLPEVMQTLAQLDATMAKIDVATVSLDPAPSGVPDIGTAISNASGQITSTLDGL